MKRFFKLIFPMVFFSMCVSLFLTGCPGSTPTSPAPTPTPPYSYLGQIGSNIPAGGTGNGQLNFPMGVAVDGGGNVFISDTYNNRVQKFDSTGAYVLQWGSSAAVSGSGNGQFYSPQGIAMDSFTILGFLYVVDSYNSRVQKFNPSGTYVTQWGSYGVTTSQFEDPMDVAVDGAGNVYISDYWNNRIEIFNSNGVYLSQLGNSAPASGSGPGDFRTPHGVGVDGSGNIYVADWGNSRIEKFNSSGTFLAQWGQGCGGVGQLCLPSGLTVDSAGNVFVTDQIENLVQKFSSAGTFITTIGSNSGVSGSGDGQFNTPHGVALDGSGNVYVADSGNNRVQIFRKN